jgi:hypothetical protein
VRWLVDNERVQEAYDLAAAYGLSATVVRRAVRARDEYAAALQFKRMLAAMPASNDTYTEVVDSVGEVVGT